MDGLWLEVWVGFFWRSKNCVASKAVRFSPPEALPFVLRFFDVAMLEFA